jgi:hypothetical protein
MAAAKVHLLDQKVTVNGDAIFAVKSGVGNLDVAGRFVAGEKTLRQRRTLIGKRTFCCDNRQFPLFTTLCDELLGGIAGNHAPAQNDERIGFHGFGSECAFLKS